MAREAARQCLEAAIARAGCDDFGPTGFEAGLARTLDAFAQLPLKPKVREAVHDRLVEDLANRLRIERWYREHPAIADQEIEGPILVCGLPRTGTTATVGMLALDPRFRFLRGWEAASPVPPPRLADEAGDPRAIAAREAAKRYEKPEQHIHDPDGPEEDLVFLAPLTMQAFHGALPMPDDYIQWWMDGDCTALYAYHRRVLKLLQSRRGPNLWLLKAPPHLFRLKAFFREYPNSKFVWTHRDPAKVIPSNASLQYSLHSERCPEASLDKLAAGPKALAFWAEGMRRALAARARIGEDRFIDVWNDDVVARPVETFEKLYDRLGFDFTGAMKGAIEAYGQRNARGAFGEHHYTAEEYGLTSAAIRAGFRDYIERFKL